jgi:glutamate-ammonia-ligase adenylyltransferase
MTLRHLPVLPPALAAEALDRWQAFLHTAATIGAEALCGAAAEETPVIFGISDFIARTARRHPHLPGDLWASGDLERPYPAGYYRAAVEAACASTVQRPEDPETILEPPAQCALMAALRRLRQREMVRIAWRDLSGRADLEETLNDLSELADACLGTALGHLHRGMAARFGQPLDRHGQPLQLVVIGMGKLGARELNFSSDVDLIFAFPEGGHTRGGNQDLTNEEFFTRLCRRLIHVLSTVSDDGFVFRVDLGLRPFGESGPLAMSFPAMERYYQSQGREWERYAWIKARPVAGDFVAGARLLDMLRPFIFRRYLDYGVFESLRDMKRKIEAEVARKGLRDNIKLGAGGIREIEFFGQIFQLVRGGVAPALQERRILTVLDILGRQNYIHQDVRNDLAAAYIFLRRVENRLQEFGDQQTHQLPSTPENRLKLALTMDCDSVEAFETALASWRGKVHTQFRQLLAAGEKLEVDDPGKGRLDALADVWLGRLDSGKRLSRLAQIGFDAPAEIDHIMEHLRVQTAKRSTSPEGRQRLDRLMPLILSEALTAKHPPVVLARVVDLLLSIGRRTTYLALLLENPSALRHLFRLVEASSLIASFLARHPVLLDELLDPRTLYSPPGRDEMARELDRRLARLPAGELEYRMEEICIFRQVNTLRIAAADVTGTLPLMRVSDHLSDLAEIVLGAVLEEAWQHLLDRHGHPAGIPTESPPGTGFAIIGYGKLGGLELGYGSDLDLVFVHGAGRGQTSGPQSIDNSQFFARIGQRLVHILTSHTRAGRIYEADMRLRPSGSAGPLVSHADAFAAYQETKAWTWEHQALIRARAVGGDLALGQRFAASRQHILTQRRDTARLLHEVRAMRDRLRHEHAPSPSGWFDLKHDPGGIIDIEFLVQFLVLAHAAAHPGLVRWSDNVRQLETLMANRVLNPATAQSLRNAYLAFRAASHRLSLQEQPALITAEHAASNRQHVTAAWQTVMHAED